jgi:hypothetical protein
MCVRWLCLRPPHQLDEHEREALCDVLENDERLATGYELLQRFRRLVVRKNAHDPAAWLEDAQASGLRPFISLARGIQSDLTAGVPLALELAASRVRMLPVAQIAARLNQRFSLLVSRSQTVPARHRALQATFDWSYDLLPPAEKELFRAVSVFAGDWSLEAAQALLGGDVTDTRGNLVEKSLVLVNESNAEMRFRLLETARQYALSTLVDAGEEADYRRRHFEWCLSIAQRAERDYWTADQWTSCAHVEREFENIRAAFEWARADVDRAEECIELAGALWHFWDLMGHVREGRGILRQLLPLSSRRTAARAQALAVYGWMPVPLGEGPPDEAVLRDCIELSRELGLIGLAALCLGGNGTCTGRSFRTRRR